MQETLQIQRLSAKSTLTSSTIWQRIKKKIEKTKKNSKTDKGKKEIVAYFPFAYASVKSKNLLLNQKAAQSTKQTVEEGTVPMLLVLQI